jgi:hypothetical protein
LPAQPQWLLQLPRIIAEVAAVSVPVIDRRMVERLFGVRRRRAIELMHVFGGLQSGQGFLLDRLDLIRQLKRIQAGAGFAVEEERRQRLVEALEEARRYRVSAKVSIPVLSCNGKLAKLPDGIWLAPGSLKVDFRRAEELLGKLFALAQTAAADFEAFRSAVDGGNSGVL